MKNKIDMKRFQSLNAKSRRSFRARRIFRRNQPHDRMLVFNMAVFNFAGSLRPT